MEPQDIKGSAFDLGGFIALVRPDMSNGDQVCIAETFIDIFGARLGLDNSRRGLGDPPPDKEMFILNFCQGYRSISPNSPISRHYLMSRRKRK